MKRVLRYSMMVAGSILVILALIQTVYLRSFTFSTLITPFVFLMAGMIPLLVSIFPDKVKKLWERKWFKICFSSLLAVYAAGLIFVTVMFCIMVPAGKADEVPANTPAVVLGARVINDKPGTQLAERLDAAYDYLIANPEAKCIVTGGLQSDCTLPQGTVMKEYLVNKGIAPDRIIEENEAWDTNENFEFSKNILDEYNLGNEIALVTSEYHQYRSQLRAKQYGLTTYSVPSKTSYWWILPQSYIREMIGVLEYLILG